MMGIKINDDLMAVLKAAYNESKIQELLVKKCVYFDWQDKKLQKSIVSIEKVIRRKRTDRLASEYRWMLRGKLTLLWQMRENQRPAWNGVRRLPSVTTAE